MGDNELDDVLVNLKGTGSRHMSGFNQNTFVSSTFRLYIS